MTFSKLGLSQPVLETLARHDYTQPTPIQEQAIPTVLTGRDLLGIAQTGTGKTAAFMLPSIDRLARANRVPRPATCRMLVLAPTRELAGQIADNARKYARGSRLSVTTAFGGVPINKHRRALAPGVDILIATPGRLIDLVEQGFLALREVEILVLDEADQMLDLGFIHALKRIVKMVPHKRQTLFFSATMPKTIRQLADSFLTDPAEVRVAPAATTAERVDQFVSFVSKREKQALLTIMLDTGMSQRGNMERVLIFSRTKHGADRIVKHLAKSGFVSAAIHGNKSQPQRDRALKGFRDGDVPILVATDIAARGIDVSGVSHVINYDLPNVAEQYVHRIGRTARAGATGYAISFCADDERAYLKSIEKLIRLQIERVPLPEDFVGQAERINEKRDPVPMPKAEPRHKFRRKPKAKAHHKAKPTHAQQRKGPNPNRKPGGKKKFGGRGRKRA